MLMVNRGFVFTSVSMGRRGRGKVEWVRGLERSGDKPTNHSGSNWLTNVLREQVFKMMNYW